MKFTTYLDNRFQEAQIANAQPKFWFSWYRLTEADACQYVISGYRFVWALFLIPWVLLGFVLIHVGLRRVPQPLLAEAMSEEAQRKRKQARKVGMPDKVPGA